MTCQNQNEDLEFAHEIYACENETIAWQITAQNLLAAIFIKQQQLDGKMTSSSDVRQEYERLVKLMSSSTITALEAHMIRKSVVKQYGYKFADSIVEYTCIRNIKEENEVLPKQPKLKKVKSDKTKKTKQVPFEWKQVILYVFACSCRSFIL